LVAAAWCAAPIRSGLLVQPREKKKCGIFLEFPLKSGVDFYLLSHHLRWGLLKAIIRQDEKNFPHANPAPARRRARSRLALRPGLGVS
jgi:hypothetical protein